MKREYLHEYIEDRKLRASLDVMTWAVLFKSAKRETIPFAQIFIRLADRVLHHSSNVWSHFISDLDVPVDMLKQIPDDAFIHTADVVSKYEIEAYLGAARALFEPNLIGFSENGKQNLLGRCFAVHLETRDRLKDIFTNEGSSFFPLANDIRNHAYHVNAQLRDIGVVALLKQVHGGLKWTPKLRPPLKLDFSRFARCEKEQIDEKKTQTV